MVRDVQSAAHFLQLDVDHFDLLVVFDELCDDGAVGQRQQLRVLHTHTPASSVHTPSLVLTIFSIWLYTISPVRAWDCFAVMALVQSEERDELS
jgi:hypothetical protein